MARCETIWLGAVAYNPKVVTIWEGMRRFFGEEAGLPVEIVLFQTYEAQVAALLAAPGDPVPRIDIAWNTNLAFLQAREWSTAAARPLAMRDTRSGVDDDDHRTDGRSGRARLPTCKRAHARARQPRQRPRGDTPGVLPRAGRSRGGARLPRRCGSTPIVGKHGDTGTSEVDVLRGVLDGRADAGRGWKSVLVERRGQRIVPAGALRAIWTSPRVLALHVHRAA